jgi:hypothetical protein
MLLPFPAAAFSALLGMDWVAGFFLAIPVSLAAVVTWGVYVAIAAAAAEARELSERLSDPANDAKLKVPDGSDLAAGLFFVAMGGVLAILPVAIAMGFMSVGVRELAYTTFASLPMLGCFLTAWFVLHRYAITRAAWSHARRDADTSFADKNAPSPLSARK